MVAVAVLSVRAAGARGPLLATTYSTSFSSREVIEILARLVAPGRSQWPFSQALFNGGVRKDHIELFTARRMHLVTLRIDLEPTNSGTTVHVRMESVLRSAIPALFVVAGLFGALMATAAILSQRQPVDLVLSLLVPLLSGVFTIIVIFVPAMWWMARRHGRAQRRWLLSYVEALFSADQSQIQAPPGGET